MGNFSVIEYLNCQLFLGIFYLKLGSASVYYMWTMRNKSVRLLPMSRITQKETARTKKVVWQKSSPINCLKSIMIFFTFINKFIIYRLESGLSIAVIACSDH